MMYILKNADTGNYAKNWGEGPDLQDARVFARKGDANRARGNYVTTAKWQDEKAYQAERVRWIATEVFITEVSTNTPAPTPPPPPPTEPEDLLEAAGLIFRMPGT